MELIDQNQREEQIETANTYIIQLSSSENSSVTELVKQPAEE